MCNWHDIMQSTAACVQILSSFKIHIYSAMCGNANAVCSVAARFCSILFCSVRNGFRSRKNSKTKKQRNMNKSAGKT